METVSTTLKFLAHAHRGDQFGWLQVEKVKISSDYLTAAILFFFTF